MLERIIDIAAVRLGLDPVDLRKRNFIPPDDFPLTTVTGSNYDVGEYARAMDEAFKGADIVYPKSWGALLTTTDNAESARIGKQYTNWITNMPRMKLANDDCNYMHCLPADRNIEVTDDVLDGPQSIVFDEAENRLHVQKAVMALTMS